ncbi:MAG: hypothetical protein ACTIIH_01680 [Brevibacterium sp.]|uniref:hypothetical protein n=1 Tax=Brevibacterium sp. TaxID=1701 RepID=UPI003F927840
MATATNTIPKADHETMLTIFQLITKSRVDPSNVVAGSLRLVDAGNYLLVVEFEHIVYDINGDKVKKPEGGLLTRTRTFHLPLGYELTEEEAQ